MTTYTYIYTYIPVKTCISNVYPILTRSFVRIYSEIRYFGKICYHHVLFPPILLIFSRLFLFLFFLFFSFFSSKTQSSTRQILIRPQLSNSLSRLTFAIAHHNWERFIVSQTSNRDMVFRYWRRRNNWRAILCLPHHVVKQRRYIVTYVSRTDHTRNHFLVGSGPSAAVQYPDH